MSYIKLSKILGFVGGTFTIFLGLYEMIWNIFFPGPPDPGWINKGGREAQFFVSFLVSLFFWSLGFLSLTGSFLLKKRPIIGSVLMLIGGIIFTPSWFYLFSNIGKMSNVFSYFYGLLCSLPFIAGLIVLINRIHLKLARKH